MVNKLKGKAVVEFKLLDILNKKPLIELSLPLNTKNMRSVAHKISDLLIEKITGKRSDFNTRIAYISRSKSTPKKYSIKITDSDGQNTKVIFESNKKITSLSWSPGGNSLAYISYEKGKPDLYTHAISSVYRKKWAAARGLNGSLTWSPSGSRLAFSLTKGNNQDIYILDILENKLIKVTSNAAVEKDPVWAIDDSAIFFTSDRSGVEQVYKVSPGLVERLVSGRQQSHSHPVIPVRGSAVYMVKTLANGDKKIVQLQGDMLKEVVELKGKLVVGSPSISPAGDMLIYASKVDNKSVLNIQSLNTGEQWKLSAINADLIEPTWSPHNLSSEGFSKHLKTSWAKGIAEKKYDVHLNKQKLKLGSAEAAYNLGKYHFGSDGIESILGEGTKYFRQAVKKGYSFDLSEYFTEIDHTEQIEFRVHGLKTKVKPETAHNWAIDDCPIKKKPSCKNTLVIIVHANHKLWLKRAYDAAYMLDKNNIPVVLIASTPKTWGDGKEPISKNVNSISLFMNGVSLTNTEGTFSSMLIQSAYLYSEQVTFTVPGQEKGPEITSWGLAKAASDILGKPSSKWTKSKSISIYELPKHMKSAKYMAKKRVR